MTAYTRCPDCHAAGAGATADDSADPVDVEVPVPCGTCGGSGCVPFQGYVLAEPEESR
ncbi:hypothetical protein LX16_2970 [Stackebrandtia albiflava]|uniref:Uncharacterized protein n=1 Tax=Stackebrandtia albiflava TaxID=406432 RepID=A0A562V2Y1_9ACTN|nr:hypothetical protein LX16_2970 [Stackebrandtia albiflava]